MRRATYLFSLALLLGMAGCDDDDGTAEVGLPDGGADAQTDGGPARCTSTFAAFNRTTLEANANDNGACTSSTDLDVVCTGDVGGKTRTCGLGCLPSSQQDAAALAACTNQCVLDQLDPDISSECQQCYIDAIGCTMANCLSECSTDPNSPVCLSCQMTQGCLPAFFQCSGLPASAQADGGASNTDAAMGG